MQHERTSIETFGRRRLLGVALGMAALSLTPATVQAALRVWPRASRFRGFDERHLTVRQVGRSEELQTAFRTRTGLPDRLGCNRLSWLFRDWRDRDTGFRMDIRLFDKLATMQTLLATLEDRPVKLVLYSGYRTPARNRTIEGAAVHSQHIQGRAADVAVDGVTHDMVAQTAEVAGAHGLGRYDIFTHVDVGRRGRRWRG